jgi:hypothetical protein
MFLEERQIRIWGPHPVTSWLGWGKRGATHPGRAWEQIP